MHTPEYAGSPRRAIASGSWILEADGRFLLLSTAEQRDLEDTRTPPAPGAIQIGPIDTA
ncbi:hypothetical protein ACOTH8_23525 [Achromobacter xylosoxidans]